MQAYEMRPWHEGASVRDDACRFRWCTVLPNVKPLMQPTLPLMHRICYGPRGETRA